MKRQGIFGRFGPARFCKVTTSIWTWRFSFKSSSDVTELSTHHISQDASSHKYPTAQMSVQVLPILCAHLIAIVHSARAQPPHFKFNSFWEHTLLHFLFLIYCYPADPKTHVRRWPTCTRSPLLLLWARWSCSIGLVLTSRKMSPFSVIPSLLTQDAERQGLPCLAGAWVNTTAWDDSACTCKRPNYFCICIRVDGAYSSIYASNVP